MIRGRYALFFLLAGLGCGGSAFDLAPVSGRVTWKGQPLANAHVSFAPTGSRLPGPGSYGRTDSEGKFSLRIETADREGAVVGQHVVRISTLGDAQSEQSDAGVKLPKDRIPPKYNTESTLTFTVNAGGTDQANFDLRP